MVEELVTVGAGGVTVLSPRSRVRDECVDCGGPTTRRGGRCKQCWQAAASVYREVTRACEVCGGPTSTPQSRRCAECWEREIEVRWRCIWRMTVEGWSDAAIARALGMSVERLRAELSRMRHHPPAGGVRRFYADEMHRLRGTPDRVGNGESRTPAPVGSRLRSSVGSLAGSSERAQRVDRRSIGELRQAALGSKRRCGHCGLPTSGVLCAGCRRRKERARRTRIRWLVTTRGKSRQEIAKAVGISVVALDQQLRRMRRAGELEPTRGR